MTVRRVLSQVWKASVDVLKPGPFSKLNQRVMDALKIYKGNDSLFMPANRPLPIAMLNNLDDKQFRRAAFEEVLQIYVETPAHNREYKHSLQEQLLRDGDQTLPPQSRLPLWNLGYFTSPLAAVSRTLIHQGLETDRNVNYPFSDAYARRQTLARPYDPFLIQTYVEFIGYAEKSGVKLQELAADEDKHAISEMYLRFLQQMSGGTDVSNDEIAKIASFFDTVLGDKRELAGTPREWHVRDEVLNALHRPVTRLK